MRFLVFLLGFFLLLAPPELQAQPPAEHFAWQPLEQRLSRSFLRLFPEYLAAPRSSCAATLDDSSLSFMPQVQHGPFTAVEIELLDADAHIAVAVAESVPAKIVISRGLLNELGSESAIAFVLAHEMGHILARHLAMPIEGLLLSERQLAKILTMRQIWEFEADRFAAMRLESAGLRLDAAEFLLSQEVTFESRHGTHPSLEARLLALSTLDPSKY